MNYRIVRIDSFKISGQTCGRLCNIKLYCWFDTVDFNVYFYLTCDHYNFRKKFVLGLLEAGRLKCYMRLWSAWGTPIWMSKLLAWERSFIDILHWNMANSQTVIQHPCFFTTFCDSMWRVVVNEEVVKHAAPFIYVHCIGVLLLLSFFSFLFF